MSEPADVKFGEWIDKGFKLYQANIGLFILAALITLLVGAVSLFILIGPLVVGLCMLTLRVLDGDTEPQPAPGDVFKGFNKFLDSFLFFLALFVVIVLINLILGVIPCLGSILALLVSYALMGLVMFVPFILAETNTPFWPACQQSIEKVKPNLLPFVGFAVVTGIIGSLGSVLCGIGIILTLPIQYCMMAVAYRDVFGGDGDDTVVEPVADETDSPTSAETQAAAEPPPVETVEESPASDEDDGPKPADA